MSAIIPKVTLRVPTGNMDNIIDLGDYYALGNLILKKDLSISQLSKAFGIPDSSGMNPITANGYSYYVPGANYASMLKLKGSGALIKALETGTAASGGCYPNIAAFIEDGQFCNYFDSTLGITAGKRILIENLDVISQGLSLGQVNAAGDVTWSKVTNSNGYGSKVWVFAESDTSFYAIVIAPFDSVQRGVVRINKSSLVTVTIIGSAQYMDISGRHIKYLGRTADDKVWMLAYPYGAPSTPSTYTVNLIVSDLITDVVTYSLNITTIHASNTNTVGIYVPTAFSVNASDTSKYKLYCVNDPNNAAGSLVIKMLQVPVAGMAVPAGFIPPAFTTCTLTGAPSIGTAYTQASLGAHACTVESWTFTDNDKEYLAVCYHATLDIVSTSYYPSNNLCPNSKHAIYVFEINAADPTNLIYKSTLPGSTLGSVTTSILLKSTDGKTLVMGSSQGFIVLKWNTITESFFAGPWNAMSLMNLHLDTSNQIWVRDFLENLYVFSPTTSNNVVIDYDDPVVSLTGNSATVNALVSSYDFTGIRQAVSLQLNVSGAKFTSNNLNSITLMTSATQDTVVPLTITTPGNVTITPVL